MDVLPGERERSMARWTLAGAFGYVGGPLLLSAALWLGFGWRAALAGLAVVAVPLAVAARRTPQIAPSEPQSLAASIRSSLAALRRAEVLRWLATLEAADLLLDVFHGFLALYLVDVARLDPGAAAIGVAVWTGAGLLGDWLLLAVLAAHGRASLPASERGGVARGLSGVPARLVAGGEADARRRRSACSTRAGTRFRRRGCTRRCRARAAQPSPSAASAAWSAPPSRSSSASSRRRPACSRRCGSSSSPRSRSSRPRAAQRHTEPAVPLRDGGHGRRGEPRCKTPKLQVQGKCLARTCRVTMRESAVSGLTVLVGFGSGSILWSP